MTAHSFPLISREEHLIVLCGFVCFVVVVVVFVSEVSHITVLILIWVI